MTRARLFSLAALLVLALAPRAAQAQSRQDQQMQQDIRIVQEQVQLLRSAVAALADQMKATNAKLDAQAETVVKNHADDSDTLRSLQSKVTALAQTISEYSRQISQVGAELPSIKAGLEQQQKQLDKILAMLAPPAPTAPGNVNTGTPPASGTPLPPSPGPAFRLAMSYYTDGDFASAAKAF